MDSFNERLKERALDLLFDSMTDLASAAKLQFSLSTGAVVLFVHATSEFQHMPIRTGILTIATFFFGFSAIKCVQALTHLAKVKTHAGDSIWRDVDKRGDLFLEKAMSDINGMKDRFGKMDRFFYTGVAWSVVFMIAQFIASVRR